MNDIAGWTYPNNDLLKLLDAQGRPLVEFSEVEDGIFEAPTPGVGVLFLQAPAAAAADAAADAARQTGGQLDASRAAMARRCAS